jgi:cell division septum initiation protein DivIVA
MSHGGELLGLGENVTTAPDFEVVLRGYSRTQVDDTMARLENEIALLAAERDEAFAQIRQLAAQVQEMHIELAERRKSTHIGEVSFRHLGPRVEQILALAEDQAEAIKAGAAQEIADRRAEAERLLASARERAARANQDFELALAARRQDEERVAAERRRAGESEVQMANEHATRRPAARRAGSPRPAPRTPSSCGSRPSAPPRPSGPRCSRRP